jgi:hypothetical protein
VSHIAESLFEPDGHGWVATALSRGPWDPRHCHGGPVSALLTRAVEQVDHDDVTWQTARLTIELVRPVPVLEPLTLATRVERPGRKVSLISAVLAAGDVEVAHVKALRIRQHALELPADTIVPDELGFPLPSAARPETTRWGGDDGHLAFHKDACEHRFVEGSWIADGPVAVWIRLIAAVVPGENPTGVQRVAAAADFGNGVSKALPTDRFVFINPDLTIHLLRPPVGEWIGMRTASHYGPFGAGLAESALYDVEDSLSGGEEHDAVRRLGRSVQSLFLDTR